MADTIKIKINSELSKATGMIDFLNPEKIDVKGLRLNIQR